MLNVVSWLTLTLLCEASTTNLTSSPQTSTQNHVQTKPFTPPPPTPDLICRAGTYFNLEESDCVECPADHISTEGSTECRKCTWGSFANQNKSTCGKIHNI